MVRSLFDRKANRTRIGFFTAFLLLLISFILTYISIQKVIKQADWIAHNNLITHELDIILSHVLEGESSFRTYIISDNPKQLTRYDNSVKDVDTSLTSLEKLSVGNITQKDNLNSLRNLLAAKFTLVEKMIADFYSSGHKVTPDLVMMNDSVLLKMNDIESQIEKIRIKENEFWKSESDKVTQYSDAIIALDVISIFLAILLTIYSILIYNKENKSKKAETLKALDLRKQLEKRVSQLAELNTELIGLRSQEKYAVTGRIARTIAHEVRNPLTNINLAIEQLQSEFPENEVSQMLFGMVSRNSERINTLVSELLNSTRVNDLTFTKMSINKVVDESLELARDRVALKDIHILKSYDCEICDISVDVDKIRIAFLNIMVNAIEAIGDRKDGQIEIITKRENDKCVTIISDNGIGMTPAQMDRLFEPYFSTKEKGNGLGLANSQNIILGHNGTITAKSEPNKGTTFIITFDFLTE